MSEAVADMVAALLIQSNALEKMRVLASLWDEKQITDARFAQRVYDILHETQQEEAKIVPPSTRRAK